MNNTDFISVYFMGEKDLAIMSFNLFEQDVKDNLSNLDEFFTHSNCVDYAKLLHKWKPNFKMFGHQDLSDQISVVEKGLKQSLEMMSLEHHQQLKSLIFDGINQIKQNII